MRKKTASVGLLLCVIFMVVLTACGKNRTQTESISALSETPVEDTVVVIATEEPGVLSVVPQPSASPETVEAEDTRPVYVVTVEGAICRSSPNTQEDNKLSKLAAGTKVRKQGEVQNNYLPVELEDKSQVWVHKWFLDNEDWALAYEEKQANLDRQMSKDSFIPMEGNTTYYCIASALNCRDEPSMEGEILCLIVTGTKVTVLGRDGNFYLVQLPNEKCCYCSMDWLSDEATYAYCPGAVDLRVFLPGAEFDLLFASSRNVTGHALYAAIPLLEQGTAFRLLEAYQKFQEDGYTIKIYDAYRPMSAQIALFNEVGNSSYIADPSQWGSWHQRGRAVDMSLIDLETGKELEMPTPMHTFSPAASRGGRESWSEDVRNNVDYMTKVMTEAGFNTIGSEWWHFEYTKPGNLLDTEIDLESLPQWPVSSYTPMY